jgi:hypothetical protein
MQKLAIHFCALSALLTIQFLFSEIQCQTDDSWCGSDARRTMELQTIPDGENQ